MFDNPDELAIRLEGGVPSLRDMSPIDDDYEASDRARDKAPDDAGESCPVCGDPYDVGASGLVQGPTNLYTHSVDVRSHVRHCTAPFPPNWMAEPYAPKIGGVARPYRFVHKDEHISEADDE